MTNPAYLQHTGHWELFRKRTIFITMTAPKLLYTMEQPHGVGELYFVWQKGESHLLLATTGTDSTVAIHDRSGQMLERIKLPGLCASMEWDNDGDILAIITPNSNAVILWECHQSKKVNVETGLREPPSCLAWAFGEPLLAVGTQKGNLALYNHHTTKRIPIIGKHTKKITCAAWNKDNILVLASEDKSLSINNAEGDTLRIIALRDTPNELQFSEMKTDERVAGENTISLIVGKRTLYLYNLLNPENPIELAFQQRYGSIVSYKWYADGYILIGFSAGYVIAISTHIKEVGEELFQVKNHKDNLTDIALCNTAGQAATCGDGQLKIISIWNNGEVIGSVMPTGGSERCSWNSDGRLLATSGRTYLNVYVTALPALYAVYGTRVVTLTSLTEATVYQCIGTGDEVDPYTKVEATYISPIEPTRIALGGSHICFVRDALAWFVEVTGQASTRRQYPGPVETVLLASDHAAVTAQGKAVLHTIGDPDPSRAEMDYRVFPEPHMQNARVTDIHLTAEYFIYVTDQGHIEYFDLETQQPSSRHQHSCGIKSIHCDIGGTRACITDDKQRSFVYSPITHDMPPIEQLPTSTKGIIWDICLTDRNTFITYTADSISTYYFAANSIRGPNVDFVAETPLPTEQIPLLLFAGDVYCYCAGGSIAKLSLESHNTAGLADPDAEKRIANQKRHIDRLLLLRRFNEAWLFCEALDEEPLWRKLAEAAIADLHIEFAIRVYTRLSDVAMVWALEDIAHIEDVAVLCGMVSACLGHVEAATEWLQHSPALNAELLAASGLHSRAAAVAANHKLATHLYTLHRAHHLHVTGDYHEALSEYEKSLIPNPNDSDDEEHNNKCESGIARMSIRCGDYLKGVALAVQHSEDVELTKECAQLLEDENQFNHAATLYENAGNIEKAASLYIKIKSWLKVESLLPKLNSPSIHIQYAKAKEAEGRYPEALKSYLKAQDFESAIRLNLDKLDDIDEAVNLVQETKSVHGAKMVAKYFQNTDDPTSAIKFLVMSLCYDEAFNLARKNGKLQSYGEILIQTSQARPEDFKSLALHFEGEKNNLLAGKFYFHGGEYAKAMGHLLKVGGSEELEDEAISVAIDTAAASDDDRLTRRLIEYLLGETDGTPREPKHLFRLYMAKKQYDEAAKTAVIISESERRAGNYRAARNVVRWTRVALRSAGTATPRDLRAALPPTHAYILVRTHVRRGRHDLAARLLDRIAKDLSFFPTLQHQVSIMTSAVIECSRAGLKLAAHHWAKVLMQPDYRSQIDPKYVKKIESLVRHVPRTARDADVTAPCPVCGAALSVAELVCVHCQADLPFCIATGMHIVKEDLTACPECDFPAILTEFVELLKDEGKCPMCDENVDYRRLYKLEDVSVYLD